MIGKWWGALDNDYPLKRKCNGPVLFCTYYVFKKKAYGLLESRVHKQLNTKIIWCLGAHLSLYDSRTSMMSISFLNSILEKMRMISTLFDSYDDNDSPHCK